MVFGVKHSVNIPNWLVPDVIGVHQVRLPKDLGDRLSGSRTIGVEDTGIPDFDNEEFRYSQAGDDAIKAGRFFENAAQLAHGLGKTVEYLDDVQLVHHVQPKLSVRLDQIRRKDNRLYTLDDFLSQNEERSRGFAASLLSLINHDLRERTMFRRIAESDVDTVFLGQAHADILAGDPALQQTLGIQVTKYLRIEPENTQDLSNRHVPYDAEFESSIKSPHPEEVQADYHKASIEKRNARRRFNAHSIGRILSAKSAKPDYLGRFYITDVSASSLFELHINDKNGDQVQGTVYDLIGDATVVGTFSKGGEVNLSKTYDPSTVHPETRGIQPLIYTGQFDEKGFLTGKWGQAYGEKPSIVFVAKEFSGKDTVRALDRWKLF